MKRPRLDQDCILLAAGESRRMGRPKQLLTYGGEPLVVHLLKTVLEACERVVVVEGAVPLAKHIPSSPRVCLVRNPAFAAGQLGSLQAGLKERRSPQAFIMLADLPLIESATFCLLAAAGAAAPAAYPVCKGHRGHPVLLGREAIKLLLAARPDGKAMQIIAPLGPLEVIVDDPGIYLDADTPAAWEEMKLRVESLQSRTIRDGRNPN